MNTRYFPIRIPSLNMAVAMFALTAPTPLLAQSDQDAPEASQGLGDIVVTAQRREENLQRTPVAVTALGEEQIKASRITDIGAITTHVPGFVLNYVTGSQVQIALRGAGSQVDGPFADQAVAVFVDDVFVGDESSLDFDLFDVERVEVLRGPQGTLFGRNVVGGAVNIITKAPTDDPEATFEASYGRFDQLNLRGMVGGALVDDVVAGQISFSQKSSDGTFLNGTTGNRVEQDNEQSVRAKLRFNLPDDWVFTFTGNYNRDKGKGVATDLSGDVDLVAGVDPSTRVVNMNIDGGYDRTAWGLTGNLTHDFDWATLTSITAYRHSNSDTSSDLDGTPFNSIVYYSQLNRIRQFSQELRLGGDTDKLDWVAGLYFLHLRAQRTEDLLVSGAPGSFLDNLVGGAQFPEILGQKANVKSYAAFGQFTYHLTDGLRATVGARFTHDKKSGRAYCILPGIQCGEVYDVPVSASWNAFTPKFTLDYDLSQSALLYATVSRGFKGGGFQASAPDPVAASTPYAPEYAWNYEAGVKTRWLDDRLQTNLTLFRVDYSDLQTLQYEGASQFIRNAGKARVNGIEVELASKPADFLYLFANYSYLDAKYQTLIVEDQDFSGNRINFTPKHSFTAGINLNFRTDDGGKFLMRSDISHRSKVYFSPDNPARGASKYDALINASLSYTVPNGRWEFVLWGQNLTNERYRLTAIDRSIFVLPEADFLNGGQVFSSPYNDPATYGITVRWKL